MNAGIDTRHIDRPGGPQRPICRVGLRLELRTGRPRLQPNEGGLLAVAVVAGCWCHLFRRCCPRIRPPRRLGRTPPRSRCAGSRSWTGRQVARRVGRRCGRCGCSRGWWVGGWVMTGQAHEDHRSPSTAVVAMMVSGGRGRSGLVPRRRCPRGAGVMRAMATPACG